MVNSHYVPKQTLKKFAKKLCLFNVKTGEYKENVALNRAFSEYGFYSVEVEEQLNKKIMVIKNLENKIKLVGIICTAFLIGCIIISVSSIWTARTMVTDAQKKVYVLDGNVPILVNRTTMDETLDVEARSHVETFHHYFFTQAPDNKYIRYTMEKAMYLVDETGLAQYNTLKEKGFYSNILGTSAVFSIFCDSIAFDKEKMEFTYYGRQRIEKSAENRQQPPRIAHHQLAHAA